MRVIQRLKCGEGGEAERFMHEDKHNSRRQDGLIMVSGRYNKRLSLKFEHGRGIPSNCNMGPIQHDV